MRERCALSGSEGVQFVVKVVYIVWSLQGLVLKIRMKFNLTSPGTVGSGITVA